jgi:hypothetical protein
MSVTLRYNGELVHRPRPNHFVASARRYLVAPSISGTNSSSLSASFIIVSQGRLNSTCCE